MKIRILTIVFLFISYQGFSQEIKNYAEAKSVVMAYLDTLKTLQINEINLRTKRKYKVFSGNLKGLYYRKKVKKYKSGLEIAKYLIYNAGTQIGYIITTDNEIFYANVWYNVSPTRTDILVLSKNEFKTTQFLEGKNLSSSFHKLK